MTGVAAHGLNDSVGRDAKAVVVGGLLAAIVCTAHASAQAPAPAPTPPAATPPAAAPPAPGATAGEAPAAGAPDAEPPAPPSDASAAERADDPVWQSYHHAFEMLASGDTSGAVATLESLRRDHPHHPAAARATHLLSILSSSPARLGNSAIGVPPPPTGTPPPPPADASMALQPTSSARAELIFFQTLHGLSLGLEMCALVECNSTQTWVLLPMLGTGAGLGLSFVLSSDGVTPGLARALTSGVEWGAWHAVALGVATEAFDQTPSVGLGLALGQLGGLGLGAGLYALLHPTAGQVSLTSSGGIWTTVVTLFTAELFRVQFDTSSLFLTAMLASDAGLVAGGLLAANKPMSAGRVLLLDAGGLLGGLLGVGVDLLAQGDNPDETVLGGLGLVGTVGGLSLSYWLTRSWDARPGAPASSLSPTLAFVRGGAVAGIGGQL